MDDLHALSAVRLAGLMRSGEVSCREVVEAHLARIAAVDGHVHAITVTLAADARAAADRADARRRSGAQLPALHGVPFTVKESLDCLGSPTTFGVRALADALPHLDSPVVSRMKAAGAIPIARTNLSELGLRLCADNPLRGRTLNPWNTRVTPGGSSGGDAVAVATGMTPLGIGSDLGGSLRVPASCCGVATLKPTTGRVPHAASVPPLDMGMAGQAMMVLGPIARSVEDLRACLLAIAGRDVRDPRSVDVALRGPAPDELRVALVTELAGTRIPADAVAAVERAGALLADAGWAVEHASPPEIVRAGEVWHKLVATDFSAVLPLVSPVISPALFAYGMRMCESAKLHETSNNRLHEERSRLMRAWSGFLTEYPVTITPALVGPPWPVDADLEGDALARLLEATRFILPGSALGLPVVGLPMGTSDGLPIGIQLHADLWREDLCLDAAAIVERGVGAARVVELLG